MSLRIKQKPVFFQGAKFICCLVFILLTASQYSFSDTFEFTSDNFSSTTARGREITVLSGNAKIISGSTTINASRIELYGNNYRYAECTGMVKVLDTKKGLYIESDRLVFDRIDDLSKLEGSVMMEDMKNEMVVKGNYLEYSGKTESATVQIGVRILKKDMACRSEFAHFDRENSILNLSGLPVVFKKGDEYRALRITVNLDTDEIFLEGKVSGLIYNEDESEEEPSVTTDAIVSEETQTLSDTSEEDIEEDVAEEDNENEEE